MALVMAMAQGTARAKAIAMATAWVTAMAMPTATSQRSSWAFSEGKTSRFFSDETSHKLVVALSLVTPPSLPFVMPPSHPLVVLSLIQGWGRGRGGARCCLDAPAAAAEADDTDICTVQKNPSNAAIDGTPCIGEGLRRGMGVLGWQPLSLHVAFRCYLNRVSSFVIFDGDLLLAVRYFSPPEAANSQFWLGSCTHKLCLRATTLPKP